MNRTKTGNRAKTGRQFRISRCRLLLGLKRILLIAFASALLFQPSICSAQSAELRAFSADIQSSTWNTQYRTAGGQLVNAQVSLQGNRGSYLLIGNGGAIVGQGNLSNIRYEIPNTGAWLAAGTWQLNGATGFFDFRSEGNTKKFTGTWGFGNNGPTKGSWNGVRAQAQGGNNGGGNNGGGNKNDLLGRQFYTSWKWQPNRNRYCAFYCFKSHPNNANYKTQWIFHYPNDNVKRNYIYYFNIEKKKYWGRCCSQHHPSYDPNVMVWNFAKDAPPGQNWGPLTKGDPSIPGSNDGTGMDMVPDAPDPPG